MYIKCMYRAHAHVHKCMQSLGRCHRIASLSTAPSKPPSSMHVQSRGHSCSNEGITSVHIKDNDHDSDLPKPTCRKSVPFSTHGTLCECVARRPSCSRYVYGIVSPACSLSLLSFAHGWFGAPPHGQRMSFRRLSESKRRVPTFMNGSHLDH